MKCKQNGIKVKKDESKILISADCKKKKQCTG